MNGHETKRGAGQSAPSRWLVAHRVAWVASGLRRAATGQGVELPVDYARRVAADGLRLADELGVTRLGEGVVIRTVPVTERQLPVVVGYAEARRQWYRDGSRHTPNAAPPAPAVSVEGPSL